MEKDSSQKHIEAFTAKYIKDIPQEMPSINFTDSVMDEILVNENVELYEYKPLISKKVWAFIAVAIGVFLTYIMSQGNSGNITTDESWLNKVPSIDFVTFPSLSTVSLYACVIFSLFIAFQVFYLKNMINNTLSLK